MKKLNRIICINSRGAVTIFLIILLLPSFLFGGYCFDLARLEAAKTMISSAGDLTLTSALTQYNKPLYNRYGLLATQVSENENNVLSDYFDSMIESSSVLPDSSSSTVNLMTSIKSYMSDPDATQFDNFVQMTTNSDIFKIKGVTNSQITNPDTLRNQIIEYMKYRGPISLASGLLTKIKTIGDIDQQAKVVEKKTDYEDKLGDIGDACLDAYQAINDYNEAVKNQTMAAALVYLVDVNNMNEICEILSYYKKSDNKIIKWSKDKLSNPQQLSSLSQDDLYKYIRQYVDLNSMLPESERSDGVALKGKELNNLKTKLKSYESLSGIQKVKSIYESIQLLNKKYDEYNKLYYYCQQYLDNYKNISQPNDSQTRQQQTVSIFYNNFAQRYTNSSGQNVDSIIYTYQNNNISDYIPIAKAQLDDKQQKIIIVSGVAHELGEKIDNVIKKLDKITKKLDDAENAKKGFQNSINKLADSEYKTNMQAQYDSSAAKLNSNDLKTLIEKNNQFKNYVSDVLSSINDGGTFYGKNIGKDINLNELADNEIATDTKTNDIQKQYVPFKTKDFKGTIPSEITTTDKFYAYLKSICAGSTESSDSKEGKSNISNALKMSGDIGGQSVPNFKDPIQSIASAGSNNIDSANEKYSSGEYNRKKSTSSILTYFKNIGPTIKSITNLRHIFDGDNSRDALYTMEYMTQMFSCYTDMENKNLVNLNGEPLNASTCKYYASEIEYILTGLGTPVENLDAVQGQIFAVRFVMNLIYAMSDSSITNSAQIIATAMAAGMPFLIPIIKTVMICAVAIAESSVDLKLLLENKDVAFIKSSSTFVCSPKGMANGLADLAKTAASKAIDDGINIVTEKINEGIDSVDRNIESYVDSVSANITKQISSTVNSAIFGKATELLTDIDNNASLTVDKIRNTLKSELEKVKSEPSSSELIKTLKNMIVDYIINNQIDLFVDYIVQEKDNVVHSIQTSLESIQKKIDAKIDGLIETVFRPQIKQKVSSVSSSLKSEVNDIANHYNSELKSEATEKINQAFDNFNTKINGNLGQSNSHTTSAGGAGFTLNYKEYLQLFLTMQLMDSSDSNSSQRRNILNRSVNLINTNLNTDKNNKVDLSKLYTVLSIKSSVNVGTSFINISFNDSNTGKIDFDLENIQKNKYTYEYNSAKGY